MLSPEKHLLLFNLSAEDLTAYGTLALAALAFVAGTIAALQIIVGKYELRLGLAKSIYKDYLALAVENPEFSMPSYPIAKPPFKEFVADSLNYRKYEFYVSNLIFAAEEILELTQSSQEWRATLQSQLQYHALYFQTEDFPESHYSKTILALREVAIARYQHEENGA